MKKQVIWFMMVCMVITLSFYTVSVKAASVYYVATNGNDSNSGTEQSPWQTIQKACDSLTAGDTVYIKVGTYKEKVTVNVSGSESGGYITIQNFGTDKVILDGTEITAPSGQSALLLINSKSFITIKGLEICNYKTSTSGLLIMGIFITGSAHHIQISNNNIHNIENNAKVDSDKMGRDAHGIAVYGTDGTNSINNIIIDGNTVTNCELGSSESMVVNGNVDTFTITNNLIHDNDNIGIDMIGWEGKASSNDQARNGVCRGNTVYNISSAGNPAYDTDDLCADAIYVDGGKDIIIERNAAYTSDIGIEVASEHNGKTTSGVMVRDNLIYNNNCIGIAFGGYDTNRGTTVNCQFLNNTLYNNDTLQQGNGEILIQKANSNTVKNNIIYCNSQNLVVGNPFSSTYSYNNTFDYNTYYGPGGTSNVEWQWQNKYYTGFAAFKNKTNQDLHSIFANPLLKSTSPLDFHLQSGSPAINAGDPTFTPATGETDFGGGARLLGTRVDCGAYENQ